MNPGTREQSRCTLAAEALRAWGVLKVRAAGVSMLPTLWPGDFLTIRSRKLEQVVPGEIVLYFRGGRFFIHRVVGKSVTEGEAFLITRGDCMPDNDPPVRSEELLGKITEIQHAGSVFAPALKLSARRRAVAYMFCHWGFLRRIGLRLWAHRHRSDRPAEGSLAGAAS